ncbi:hypothetical protein KUTeg_019833 [Tegillarca granosa]|uniref:BTB domain-containing protein n=1 Tax=Tegillarca granosa TaxID=220873 RepID=A0ABQ9EHN9_TEGGR|nr:hypothetical protein KUTeg_019833 [Tegillarca granosa]
MPPSPRKLQKTSIEEEMTPVTAMTLTSTNHSSKVMKGLQELRHYDVLCDYCLKAENITINVHRAVLAACSDYFRVMLTNDMKESRESSVELKGVSACGLRIVIDFAYTGVLELNTENVEDVLSAATHLQISDAVDLVDQFQFDGKGTLCSRLNEEHTPAIIVW